MQKVVRRADGHVQTPAVRGVRPVVLVPPAAVVAVQFFVIGRVVDVKLVGADADYGACF